MDIFNSYMIIFIVIGQFNKTSINYEINVFFLVIEFMIRLIVSTCWVQW